MPHINLCLFFTANQIQSSTCSQWLLNIYPVYNEVLLIFQSFSVEGWTINHKLINTPQYPFDPFIPWSYFTLAENRKDIPVHNVVRALSPVCLFFSLTWTPVPVRSRPTGETSVKVLPFVFSHAAFTFEHSIV